MNNNNPFEFFQSFMNQENLAKSMKWMPNMDMSSLGNIMKDTAEAITSTNQLISDTVQSIAKRGADSFQKNTSEMFNTMKHFICQCSIQQYILLVQCLIQLLHFLYNVQYNGTLLCEMCNTMIHCVQCLIQ